MVKLISRFSVFFAVILGYFCVTSCQSPSLVWCTSNGILTFNRHTGQFELMDKEDLDLATNAILSQLGL